MQEQQYRCIHAACARAFPRPVDFCPWCGTGQHPGVDNPAHASRPAQAAGAAAFQRPAPPQGAAASLGAPLQPVQPQPAAPAAMPGQPAPSPAKHAKPSKPAKPARGPVRLRWWIGLLAIVLGAWFLDKPRKVEARIERAIALGAECKMNEAQAELIALRGGSATPEQLQRLQQRLNEASATCERKELRARDWRETVGAVGSLLDKENVARAQQRLQAFVRKWGADKETRRVDDDIASARARQKAEAARIEKERLDCLAQDRRWIANTCW